MNVFYFICLLCLGAFPAWGENAKNQDRAATTKHAPDLDLNDDGGFMSVPSTDPQAASRTVSASTHPWMYWTLGFSAAAGGMAFYLWETGKASAPTKTVQVFTDAPN